MEFRAAVNVVIRKNGKILLGKRIGKLGNGKWALPGGKLELGELALDGAKRELLEETGIEAVDLRFLNVFNGPGPENHWIHFTFIADMQDAEPRLMEPDHFERWEFFEPDKIIDLFYPHKPIIAAFMGNKDFIELVEDGTE